MNFKSTLWALAFACAAVSCSDDLENGPNNNEGNEEQGGYYMTVNIATGGGSSLTKANGEGNEYLDETDNEDKVHDVNVFLIKSSNYSGTGTDDKDLLGLLNMDNATSVKIAGQGYTTIENGSPSGGTEPNHDKVEVKMQLTEPIPGTSSEKYQVFTVVNAGKKLSGITTLKELRDYVYSSTTDSKLNSVWSGAVASADKFVMSTHKMTGTPGNSEVILSAENMDASNPAVTNVYVERLAARIDLKVAKGLLSDAGLAPTGATIGNSGTFKLTGYTVVNRWNGESYLFKQVSPTVDEWDGALPGEETYGQNDPKKYLGDEKWDRTGTTTQGSFNYVVEPKTRSKTGNDWLTTSYLNPFNKDGNLNTITSNDEWVTTLPSDLSSNFCKIAYTKENTMTANMQKNGYSTGVIFESEFMPGDNFKVSKYSEGSIAESTLLDDDKTFLVANHLKGTSTQKVVYADVKTIAAMAFDEISTSSMTEAMYKGFMDGWSTDTELDDVKSLIAQMKESNKVEAAFKKYLSGIANANGASWATVKDNLTYAKFLANDTDGQKLAITGDVTAVYIGTLFEEFGISYYKGGKSYHKFWIRHDNNDNNNVMGVMEFCIVRNNVYQLDVTGVRDLGDPLPYTPGKDNPNNPDESGEVSILVNIYVKNWVKRYNSDIIL